jgi:hypothetical protein
MATPFLPSPSPSRRKKGAPKPPGAPGQRIWRCQRAGLALGLDPGGAGRQGRLTILERQDTWRPARRLKPQASALVGGRVSGSGTRPGSSFRPSPVGRVRLLPIRFQPPRGQPRRSTGRTDLRRGLSQTRRDPRIGLRPPEPGARVGSGRRRRSRPTLRRLARASPGGRNERTQACSRNNVKRFFRAPPPATRRRSRPLASRRACPPY